jgi:hypothetical protein
MLSRQVIYIHRELEWHVGDNASQISSFEVLGQGMRTVIFCARRCLSIEDVQIHERMWRAELGSTQGGIQIEVN